MSASCHPSWRLSLTLPLPQPRYTASPTLTPTFTSSRSLSANKADKRMCVHRGLIPRSDWTQVSELPVTGPARTVSDLAAAGIDGGHLAGLARGAIFWAGVALQQLGSRLAPFAYKYGAPVGDGWVFVKRLLDKAGIPASTEQVA